MAPNDMMSNAEDVADQVRINVTRPRKITEGSLESSVLCVTLCKVEQKCVFMCGTGYVCVVANAVCLPQSSFESRMRKQLTLLALL